MRSATGKQLASPTLSQETTTKRERERNPKNSTQCGILVSSVRHILLMRALETVRGGVGEVWFRLLNMAVV